MLASELLSSKWHQRGELSWEERKDFSPGKSHGFEVDGLDLVLGLPGFARTLPTRATAHSVGATAHSVGTSQLPLLPRHQPPRPRASGGSGCCTLPQARGRGLGLRPLECSARGPPFAGSSEQPHVRPPHLCDPPSRPGTAPSELHSQAKTPRSFRQIITLRTSRKMCCI